MSMRRNWGEVFKPLGGWTNISRVKVLVGLRFEGSVGGKSDKYETKREGLNTQRKEIYQRCNSKDQSLHPDPGCGQRSVCVNMWFC